MEFKKAVIPCAGIGTRFLPATKAIPKELFPIIDKPITQLIVDEFKRSNISNITFVINKEKEAIKNYFSSDKKLEAMLKSRQKTDLLKEIKKINEGTKFNFVYQNEPKGNGDAVLCAEKMIGNEPFIVNWADDLIIGGKVPYFTQLIEVYKKYRGIVLSVVKTDEAGQRRYGIIKPKRISSRVFQVISVVEKPGPERAPSNLAHIGGFILTPKIFKFLKKTKPGRDGEIWLQDAISEISKKEPVYAYEFDGQYYDVGEKLGFLKTIVKMTLQREDLKEDFQKFLNNL
ncbi:MAG: UTP--glucose-1-phosphate uridylyltransferase [Candidatus Berkelbacteria bacterium]|nr:UTP--glucose-1-phosphate uridylyltransferase [Candidatus Berkelbacteria bacterium]